MSGDEPPGQFALEDKINKQIGEMDGQMGAMTIKTGLMSNTDNDPKAKY